MDYAAILAAADTALGLGNQAATLINSIKTLLGAEKGSTEVAAMRETIQALKESVLQLRAAASEATNMQLTQAETVRQLEEHVLRQKHATLAQIAEGATVYITTVENRIKPLSPDATQGTVEAWFCQPCFDDRKPSILQLEIRESGRDTYKCHRCGLRIYVPNNVKPSPAIRFSEPREDYLYGF